MVTDCVTHEQRSDFDMQLALQQRKTALSVRESYRGLLTAFTSQSER